MFIHYIFFVVYLERNPPTTNVTHHKRNPPTHSRYTSIRVDEKATNFGGDSSARLEPRLLTCRRCDVGFSFILFDLMPISDPIYVVGNWHGMPLVIYQLSVVIT